MAFHKAKALQDAEKAVAQGKISQAIKQYQAIYDNDPSDVSLLNTVGDLYIRDRNITEGLRQFHKLAEAYVRDGFNVKAIAIYRKISKVDPNTVDTLLKLAELYQLQGLSREAREQYLQATEFFKKRNQLDRALEVLRKLVQLDPENINFRNRLAAECEKMGKRDDAAQAYLQVAEILLKRDDQAAAETALKKAAEFDPQNSKIQILRGRVAIARQELDEAETIVNSSPELQSDPAGKRILLDAYLGARKLPEAEKLVIEVFQTNPSDFAPVAKVSALLVENGEIDKAYELLSGVAEQTINQNNGGLLLEALRPIWNKAPKHIPTLELIHRICERTANELTLPEVLEAMGRAYEEAGDLEKAEAAYLKLTEREPTNENHHALLNAVQKKLGKEIKPVDFSSREMALSVAEEEAPAQPAGVDANQEAMLKEALENSDLFSRYNLTEKAIAELEKVLRVYPDQVDVHRRILEISRKGFPERGAVAAGHLARIFTERGDNEMASKYEAIATAKGPLHEIPLPPPPPSRKVEIPAPPPPAPQEKAEVGAAMEFPIPLIAPEEPIAVAPTAPPPESIPFDLTPTEAPSEPAAAPSAPAVPTEQPMELDLSGDLESLTGFGLSAPAPSVPEPVAPPPVEIPAPVDTTASPEAPAWPLGLEEEIPPASVTEAPAEVPEPPPAPVEEAVPADFEDSKIEVDFYLENGFIEEAQKAVAALEDKYPGRPFVAALRRRLDARTIETPAASAESAVEVAPVDEPMVVEPPSAPEPAPVAEEPAHEEWELPTSYAAPPPPEPAIDPAVPPPEATPEVPAPVAEPAPAAEPTPVAEVVSPPPAQEPVVEEPVAAESGSMDMLGDLAGDFAATLDGLAAPGDVTGAATPAPPVAEGTPPGSSQGAAQLDGLLAEMEEPGAAAAQDDPETHYNLGVAFREMGLLDEAIGEFQKVVKIAGKGNFPANFLQACSLLAICFMDKGMPAIAVKWYIRALDTPGLEEEALLALQYDLGLAYEQAGDSRRALERFIEVYSQNIDFRDVAEKIRELQQKA